MDRRAAVEVAMGRRAADTVVRGGRIVDVYTGEVRAADIAVAAGRIAKVGDVAAVTGPNTPIIDATGKYVSPGLIDGHLHYHHIYVDPAEGAKLLLAHGVTATADGFYGEGIVGGARAVRFLVDAVRALPIRLIFLAPSQSYIQNRKFGLTPAPGVTPDELIAMLDWEGCYGLDETPFSALTDLDPAMLPVFEATLKRGKVITGHVSGASEAEVQAFAALGGATDHEALTAEEGLHRARAGVKVLMRYGSSLPDLPAVIKAHTEGGIDPRHFAICTDVLLPETLAEEGGMDVAVRRAINCGIRPVDAIAMASLNVAETFRADHDLGSLAPGRYADMLLLDDLASLAIDRVLVGGKEVVRDGKVVASVPPIQYPAYMRTTCNVPDLPKADAFRVSTNRPDGPVAVRVISVREDYFPTEERHATLRAEGGVILPDESQDVAMIAMVDRLGKGSGMAVAFVQGFGLRSGAIASTHNAICENLAVFGTSAEDMAFAAAEVVRIGGGQVVVSGGKLLAAFPMQILGLFSDRPAAEALADRARIRAAIRDLGSELSDPMLRFEFCFAAAEFPLLRMSEEGLIRTHPPARVNVVV